MNHKEVTVENLVSPEHAISPAPLLPRFVAFVIDSFVIAALYTLFTLASKGYVGFTPAVANAVYAILLAFAYYFLQEGIFAATVGKFVTKLRVVDRDGDPCSFLASCIRNVLRFVDWLPMFYIIGGAAILTSRSRQRIGDRVAVTVVVRAPEKDINPPPAPFLFH